MPRRSPSIAQGARTMSTRSIAPIRMPPVPAPAPFAALASPAAAQSAVIGWGKGVFDTRTSGEVFADVAAGALNVLARRADGKLAGWGENLDGQALPPALSPGVTCTQITSGPTFGAALLSNGTVLAWGDNYYGQCNAPTPPPGLAFVQIDAGIE